MADEPTAPVLTGWQWLLYKSLQWVLPSLVAAIVAYLSSLPARNKAASADARSVSVEQVAHENRDEIKKLKPLMYGAQAPKE